MGTTFFPIEPHFTIIKRQTDARRMRDKIVNERQFRFQNRVIRQNIKAPMFKIYLFNHRQNDFLVIHFQIIGGNQNLVFRKKRLQFRAVNPFHVLQNAIANNPRGFIADQNTMLVLNTRHLAIFRN